MWKKRKKPGLVKQTDKKRRGKETKPREINLDAILYYPLPPAPSKWDIHIYAPWVPAEDFFEVSKRDQLTIESITKIDMEDRPDPAYRTSNLQARGVPFS